MFKKAFRFILIFSLFSFLTYLLTSIFSIHLPFWEKAVLISRRYHLGSSFTPTPTINLVFGLLTRLLNLIAFLDKHLFFFPSFLRQVFWTEKSIYTLITLPIFFSLSLVLTLMKSWRIKTGAIIMAAFFIIPIPHLLSKGWNHLVFITKFNFATPLSAKEVWIWSNEKDPSPYTTFRYTWRQKRKSNQAEIKISSLGHYRLIVNGKTIYDGPSFAVYPKIYFDTLSIADYIIPGEKNEIIIVANFIQKPVHEHAHYSKPGLLVGGRIKDGILSRNLADYRFWQGASANNVKNGKKIPGDAGFTEIANLAKPNYQYQPATRINRSNYQPYPRPLPLLTYEKIIPKKIGAFYDLGKFMTGYLNVKTNFKNECPALVSWGAELNIDKKLKTYFDQIDEITFPKGESDWRQLSRRAGRYITIDQANCGGEIKLEFYQVGMPFEIPKSLNLKSGIDEEIYQLSLNTLKNNIQDHFEDCVEREKAMYIGDAFAVSKCLMKDDKNGFLVREMINQFAESQEDNGIIPSMTPSGKKQFIPSYTLQWVVWLDWYVSTSNDTGFAKEMQPRWELLMKWAENNESEKGFLYNKKSQDWWNFIDWTPLDNSHPYSTPLQVWYIKALTSASHLAHLTESSPEGYEQKVIRLKTNLLDKAFNEKLGIFSDSFSDEKKAGGGVITNALAGKFHAFPTEEANQKAVGFFKNNLTTDSPFSQTWVIEWLLEAKETALAHDILRDYWGSMVNEGATSIYEVYSPKRLKSFDTSISYSHAWGCGPIHLYQKILREQ